MYLYRKYRNLIVYSIFGFLATLVNVLAFGLLHNHYYLPMLVANTIAWFLANLFSFFANKWIVFKTKKRHWKYIVKEIVLFLLQRVFSLILDNLFMTLGITFLHFPNMIVKIIDQLVVGLINYLSTKAIFMHENSIMIKK